MAVKENTLRNEFREEPLKPAKEKKANKERKEKEKKQKEPKDPDATPFSVSLNNPRMRRILGLLLISSSVFVLLSLISFLFSWQIDQSIVKNLDWDTVKQANPEMTQNWMGLFGAWISHLLIYRWFGIASFAFVPLLFITGFKLLFESKNIRLGKIYTLSFISIIFFSLLFGFLSSQLTGVFGPSFDYLGGAMGYEGQLWMSGVIGAAGVAIVLTIALLSYLVIAFNLNFRLPQFKKTDNSLIYTDYKDEAEANSGFNSASPFRDDKDEDEEEDEDFDDSDFKLIVLPDKNKESKREQLLEENEERTPLQAAHEDVSFKVKTAAPVKIDTSAPVTREDDRPAAQGSWYKYPALDILKNHENANAQVDSRELEERKNLIVETLENYKIKIDRIEATIGPTVTLYEIVPAAGIRISRIKSLEDDIALSLSALGIRIIAPMPGKGTIGIEVPNQNPQIVSLKEALASPEFRNSTFDLPIALGKTISNEVFVADLTKMPHLLMAGATGQGKSVGINTIIASILYKKHPEDVKFILVDPKKVELSLFKNIENHFLPELPDGQEAIITDTKMVVGVLKSLCVEMDERYDKLKDAQVRNIKEYNKKIERGLLDQEEHKRLPYIILVIDELADLMMTAGKEVEMPIARLAQLARAIGIHLIVATQRPSVNIITGVIKANFPSRIAFRVTSRIDSRTILDTGGSEQLIGRGDMLYSTGNELIRLQCPYIDTDEVELVTQHIRMQPYPERFRLNIINEDGEGMGFDDFGGDDMDPLFEDAARLIVNTQQGSTSMLQRRLKLGYNRAGRLMDQLEKAKIVGGNEGSKAREVLIGDEFALEQFLKDMNSKLR
jgi:S-DNA-T family DNA segregation ATPase FtsK/SpoIIIE